MKTIDEELVEAHTIHHDNMFPAHIQKKMKEEGKEEEMPAKK